MLQLIFTCFSSVGTQRALVWFRTTLGKFPGPAAHSGLRHTARAGPPLSRRVAEGSRCPWQDTQAEGKSRGIQKCGNGE